MFYFFIFIFNFGGEGILILFICLEKFFPFLEKSNVHHRQPEREMKRLADQARARRRIWLSAAVVGVAGLDLNALGESKLRRRICLIALMR